MIEDRFLTNQLIDFFDDDSVEIKGEIEEVPNQKREASVATSGEERLGFLYSPINLTNRANHYWTRKRGRDKTSSPDSVWEIYYTLYPTKRSMSSFKKDSISSRKKREAIKKLLRLNKLSSRMKREAENSNSTDDETSKLLMAENNKNKEKPKWKNFERKL